jgi:hypothetical protein
VPRKRSVKVGITNIPETSRMTDNPEAEKQHDSVSCLPTIHEVAGSVYSAGGGSPSSSLPFPYRVLCLKTGSNLSESSTETSDRGPARRVDGCELVRKRGNMRLLVLFLLLITNGLTFAQDYPTKPVRMIEPFGAGGGPDLVSRVVSPKLSALWGQPVTVENHPGAGSTAAAEPGDVPQRPCPHRTKP